MEADTFDRDDADQPKPGWGRHLSWPALLLLAWVLYELTAQPALGVAMICVKFGWEDFVTAVWLRKRDKGNPPRGRAAFWLYVASGLWTTAITATVMIFAFAFLAGFVQARGQGPPRAGPPPHVIGALLTAFFGFGLSTLLTGWALLLAVLFRVKLWLCSAVHRARRANVWPPPDTPGRGNKLMWLIVTALIMTLIPAVILVTLLAALVDGPGKGGGVVAAWLPLVITGTMFGGPVAGLILRDFLARRVIALSASDCWPPGETWPDEERGFNTQEVAEF